MTRVLAALVLGASILGLAACSGGGVSSMTPTTQSVAAGQTTPDGGALPPNH